ncbi:MAG TPA: 50S ribosomal protein L13 [Sedimentisphaerales bacterium]|nr:50S ribosomal protein L13 [Sedimentisphaerales bacterium]
MAKNDQVEHKWLLVDAEGAVLGRIASKLAMILMGKNKPTYTPHVDMGDFVVVVNAEKIRLTGNKAEVKTYESYSGYPGGHKYTSYAKMLERKPEKILELAVRRMLPKTQMGRKALSKLKIYSGAEHENQAQQPQKVQLF